MAGINFDAFKTTQQEVIRKPITQSSGGINFQAFKTTLQPTIQPTQQVSQPIQQISEYQPQPIQQVTEDYTKPMKIKTPKVELSEQTKRTNEQLIKSPVGEKLSDPLYFLKVLVGREQPISEALNLSPEETMSQILQVQEAERISSPTKAGITEGVFFGGVEKTIKNTLDKYSEAGITPESLYRGEEITDTSAFRTGEVVGKTGRYVTSYLLLGGGVASAFSPAKASLAAKITGLTGSTKLGYMAGVLAQEYAKDVAIGMPQYFIEAKNKELQGSELIKYMAKESARDFAMNLGMYGVGSLFKLLKNVTASELGSFGDKMVKSISKETGVSQDEAFKAVKSMFEEQGIVGKKLDKAYEESRRMLDLYGYKESFKADNLKVINKIDDIQSNLSQTRRSIAEKLIEKPNYKEIVPGTEDLVKAKKFLAEIKKDLKKPDFKPLPANKFKYVVGEKIDLFGNTYEVTGTKNGNYILTDVYGVERVEVKDLLEQATTRYGGTGVSNIEIKLRKKVSSLSKQVDDLKSSNIDRATRQQGLDAIEKEINAYNIEIEKIEGMSKLEKANLKTWWAKEQNRILELQYKEKALINAERSAEKEIKDIVFNKLKKLNKDAKRNNLVVQVENAFEEIKNAVDTKAKSISKKTLEETQLLKFNDDSLRSFIPDYKTNPIIEEKINRISKTSIANMTVDELVELNEVVDYIVHANKTAKMLINNPRVKALQEVAEEIKTNHKTDLPLQVDVKSKARLKAENVINLYFREGAYDPHVLFKMMGDKTTNSKVYSLYESLVDGDLKRSTFLRDGTQLLDSMNMKSFQQNNGVVPVKLSNADTPVNMSLGERISVYLHMKNADNFASLTNGGGRIESMTRTVPFQQVDFDNIIKTLSSEEIAFADRVGSEFFNTYLKDGINSTSYDLDGIFIAKVKDYFRKTPDELYRNKDYVKFKQSGTKETMSLLHARSGAEIPIVIEDVFDVINSQLKQVSEYHGYAVPLRNTKLVFGNADVNKTLKEAFDGRMKAPIDDLIKNLDGGNYLNDVNEELIGKAITNTQMAALGVNPKVWMNQLASFFTAASELEPQYLVRGFSVPRPTVEFMSKYSAPIWERNLGMATRETAEAISKGGKIAQASVVPIQKFDMEVVKSIWNGVDIKMKDAIDTGNLKMTYGSDDFYEAVARETERIIQRNQPNYNSLFRSQAGRQRTVIGRIATLFSTQTNKNFNIVTDAIVDYQATGSAKQLFKAVPAVISSSLVIAGLNTGQKKLRGKETDFVKDAMSSFARNVYIVNQVDNKLFKGYDVDNIAESSINDFLDAIKTVADPDKQFNEKMYKLTDSVGKLFVGLPIRNVRNTLSDIFALTGQTKLQYQYDKLFKGFSNTELYSKFYDAYENDDDELLFELLKDMKEKEIKFSNLSNSMKSRGVNVYGLNRFRSFLNN